MIARLRTHLAALAFGTSLALSGGPASALERFVLRLPFLETEITINFADGESAEQLIQASPDLQDLELASGGKLLPLLRQVFLTPLPLETKALLVGSTSSLRWKAPSPSLRVVGVMSKAALSTSATASDVAGLLHQAEGMRVVPWVQIHCTTTQLRFFIRFDWLVF